MPSSKMDIASALTELMLVGIHIIVLHNVPVYPIEYNVPYVTLDKIVPNYPPNKNE